MTENTFKILPDSAGEKTTSNLIPTARFTTEENDETTQRFYDAEDGSVAVGVGVSALQSRHRQLSSQ